MHAFGVIADGSSACVRILIILLPLTLIVALTTPGRPRSLRFVDWRDLPDLRKVTWRDFSVVIASLLLFTAGILSAKALTPDLSQPLALPPDGEKVYQLLAKEAARMGFAVRAPLFLGGISLLVFGSIAYRLAQRLWQGFSVERRRRRAEANVLVIKQF